MSKDQLKTLFRLQANQVSCELQLVTLPPQSTGREFIWAGLYVVPQRTVLVLA